MKSDLRTYLENFNYVKVVNGCNKTIEGYIEVVGSDYVIINENRAYGGMVTVYFKDITSAEGHR